MTHKNIFAALAAAQCEMGAAVKSASNPHFKTKYADLASVIEACGEALNKHGIAYFSVTDTAPDGGWMQVTTLSHGESETSVSCAVPLIIAKNDMQGFGSACTYARRYGLMALAGIAPEDDDGNAAAKAAPPRQEPKRETSHPAAVATVTAADWCREKAASFAGASDPISLDDWWRKNEKARAKASADDPKAYAALEGAYRSRRAELARAEMEPGDNSLELAGHP